MKKFYSDCVAHYMRHYTRFETSRSSAEIKNRKACESALGKLPPEDRAIIKAVYRDSNVTSEGVTKAVEAYHSNSIDVWRLVTKFELMVAKARGLI